MKNYVSFLFSQKRKNIILFTAILLAIILSATLFFLKIPNEPPKSNNSLEIQKQIVNSIDKYGLEQAYQKAAEEYKAKPLSYKNMEDGHIYFHVFGEVIFEQKGLDGINFCDETFVLNGCYHGFILKAVSKIGLPVINEISLRCQNVSECQHGLGHAVLELNGTDKLIDSLNFCSRFKKDTNYNTCQDGVFMQYFFPDPINKVLRKLDTARPYDVCSSISEEFKYNCFYGLPQWWLDHGNNYQQIGQWCLQTSEDRTKTACFRGMGVISILSSGLNIDEVKSTCNLVDNQQGRELCLLSAYGGLWTLPEHREKAKELCQGISEEFKKVCLKSRET
ncbi:MAG TPA: hypothetical protein VIK81_02900 [Patescibacteria group bacterium]